MKSRNISNLLDSQVLVQQRSVKRTQRHTWRLGSCSHGSPSHSNGKEDQCWHGLAQELQEKYYVYMLVKSCEQHSLWVPRICCQPGGSHCTMWYLLHQHATSPKKTDFTEITGALWIIPGSCHRKLLTAGAVGAGTAAKMRLKFCLAKANSSRRLLSKAVLTWHL